MNTKNNLQKWCALFAEIQVPQALMITILKNANENAETIIWEHLRYGWLPARIANLERLRQMMPQIRQTSPNWQLDDDILLSLSKRQDATELLKLYIMYTGILSPLVLQELKEHPQSKKLLPLYTEWK